MKIMQSKSKWVKSESMLEENIKSNSAKYGIPLKPRIDVVLKQIHLQTSKIDTILNDLKSKDHEMFRKTISSTDVDNAQYSAVLLSDLAQIRKVRKMLSISKILFEELENNLSTVSDFVDLATILSPALAVVKNLRSSLIRCMPETEDEIGLVSELLAGILVDAGLVGNYTINFKTANEEAVRMINEASLIAEQKIKEQLPDLPSLSSVL
jgi:division protein CdvB (Snf7/Vps24/ESCRT-III family)